LDTYKIKEFEKDLLNNERELFIKLYKKYFPIIRNYIINNNGNENDAKDIFQEAIIAIIRNIENNQVNKEVRFISYLYSISKYIWLKQIRKNKYIVNNNYNNIEEIRENSVMIDLSNTIDDSIEKSIFQKNFLKLGKKCQELLTLFFQKFSLKEIAEIMGFKSENYVKKKKFYCKEKLIKLIKEDKEYQKIMKDKDKEQGKKL